MFARRTTRPRSTGTPASCRTCSAAGREPASAPFPTRVAALACLAGRLDRLHHHGDARRDVVVAAYGVLHVGLRNLAALKLAVPRLVECDVQVLDGEVDAELGAERPVRIALRAMLAKECVREQEQAVDGDG